MRFKGKILILIMLSILLGGCANVDKNLLKASNLVEKGDHEKAIKIYKNLIEKDNNPDFYMGLANAYKDMGDENLEEESLKEGLIYCDDKEEIYGIIVDFYEAKHEDDKFLKLYERYKDKIYNERAILNVSKIYKNRGEGDLAFQELQNIEIDKAEDLEVLEELLPFYLADESRDKLEKIVSKGISINDKGTIFYTYKYLLDNQGEFIIKTVNSADLDNDGILENVFVITDGEGYDMGTYAKMIVQNGKTGEIIDELDLNNIYIDFYVDFGKLTDDNKKDILLNAHVGGNGTHSSKFLYGFDNNKLNEKDLALIDDIEFTYLHDFKIEVSSKQFDRVYSFDIGKEYRDEYIEYNYYTSMGKVLESSLEYGLEQVDLHHIDEINKDGLISVYPYYGTYMVKDYIGSVEIIYTYDGTWKAYDMDILDNDGNKMEYKKYAEKAKAPEIPTMDDTVQETKKILNMTKSQVYENFGQPDKIDSYQVEYFDYGDKYIFFNAEKVSSVWWIAPVDKFGIKGRVTNQKVKEIYGKPIWEGYDEAGLGEYVLNYKIGGLYVNFSDIDYDYGGFIHMGISQ